MKKPKLKRNKYFKGYKKLKHVKLFEGFLFEQNWTKTEESLDPFQAAVWEAVKELLKQEVVEDDRFELFYDDSEIDLKPEQMQFDYWDNNEHTEGDEEDPDDERTEEDPEGEEDEVYNILSIFVERSDKGVKVNKFVQHFVGNGGEDINIENHEVGSVEEAAKIIAGYLNSWNEQ